MLHISNGTFILAMCGIDCLGPARTRSGSQGHACNACNAWKLDFIQNKRLSAIIILYEKSGNYFVQLFLTGWEVRTVWTADPLHREKKCVRLGLKFAANRTHHRVFEFTGNTAYLLFKIGSVI